MTSVITENWNTVDNMYGHTGAINLPGMYNMRSFFATVERAEQNTATGAYRIWIDSMKYTLDHGTPWQDAKTVLASIDGFNYARDMTEDEVRERFAPYVDEANREIFADVQRFYLDSDVNQFERQFGATEIMFTVPAVITIEQVVQAWRDQHAK